MARSQGTHWTIRALAISGIVALGWLAWDRFQRSDGNERVQAATQPAQSAPTPAAAIVSVPAGTSVEAPIAGYSLKAERVSDTSADLTVTSATRDTYRFKDSSAGQRLVIPAHDGTYYLDIVRVQGNVVDLTMRRQ
jgi:hypothetical protein